MNRRLILSAGVAVAATAAGVFTWLGRGKSQAPQAPQAADAQVDPVASLMALRLPDLSGASHSLDAWKGQPMLVNFWATWCAPCVKEMPELDALQKNIRKCALWVSALIQPPICRNLSRKCRFRIRCGCWAPVASMCCASWAI